MKRRKQDEIKREIHLSNNFDLVLACAMPFLCVASKLNLRLCCKDIKLICDRNLSSKNILFPIATAENNIRSPYNTFLYYLSERFSIWQRRESNELIWTRDPIFLKYKFTNVLRKEDRTTRWLINNWYLPNKDQPLEIQALNCGIARYFGRVEFLEELGYQNKWEPKHVLEVAKRRLRQKKPIFTGAYIITTLGKTDPKDEVVVNLILQPYFEAIPKLVKIARSTKSWKSVSNGMEDLPGMGPFMTKEILLDWQLTPLLSDCVDSLTWTPAGPGAIRGLRRLEGLTGAEVKKSISQPEALRRMQELLNKLSQESDKLPKKFPIIGSEFGVTDVQFCLCELDKYMRVQLGEGRPRSTFKRSK